MKIVFALLLSLFGLASSNAATYIDIFNKNTFFVIEQNSVQLADVVHDAIPCAESEAFVCIRSDRFSIGVPKDAKLKKWNFSGSRYQVMGEFEGIFFGVYSKYRMIAVDGSDPFEFAYSSARGVIAFKVKGGNSLILNESCGLLAQTAEAGCLPKK